MEGALQALVQDILIVGAGMAGLSAARALAERGLKPRILEAQSRTGGRILTRHREGTALELGAEFVHGRAPELWALITESGAIPVERSGVLLREEAPGSLTADEDGDDPFASMEALESLAGPDVSFADWLAASDIPEEQRAALTGYVEGFNAADATRISARSLGLQQRAEDATEGDRSWHLPGGYGQLIAYLAERVRELGCELRLDTPVTAIRWSDGVVHVETPHGTFATRKLLITLPLGVLQQVNRSGGLTIDPEPAALAHARRMAMGHAARFSMVFREPWWTTANAEASQLSFLLTPQRCVPVWWTTRPEAAAVLTGWCGGPRAAAFAGRSSAEIEADALRDLADIFSLPEADLRAQHLHTAFHNWDTDPWSRGAYSYVPVGAADASAAMAQPEAETLFFAGEHTDITGHWGTVHAALRSGLRAARQILGG